VDFKRVETVGYRTEQQALRPEQAHHFLDAEPPHLYIYGILQDRRAQAKVEQAIPKWQWLAWGNTVKLTTVSHTIELGAHSSHLDFFRVDISADKSRLRINQSEGYSGASGAASKIEYSPAIGRYVARDPRD
jgi:hypothetical protein